MKKVKLVLGGKEVLVIGTSQTIRQVAADRLGCANDRVVFKIEDNGELCEFADTRPAWEHLARENTTIHAFVGAGATLKRKAAAENEEQGFESDASSFKTPPRDTHRNASSSRNAARENGTSVAVRSESSRAGTSSGKSVSSRKRWTTKDDQLLWRKLNLILDAMQRPDPVYTADDSDKVFKTLQRHGVFSARSVHALKSRVQRKASLAQRRGQPCPARVKALFPLMTYRSSRDGTRQSAQLIGGNETSDSTDSSEEEMDEDREEAEVSTASEPTPPPQAARHPTGEKERPVIRDYNPFAPYAAVRPPSWTTSSRSAAANDVQASSSAKTLVAQQKSMAGSLPASNSSLVPERPTLSVSHRSPDESTILEGTRIGTNSGGASREAIVIKDESDEEQTQQALVSNDSSSVEIKREPVTLSFAAERPAVRRAVAAHTRELFPLQRIDVLPPVKWAVELAKWIKDGVLESIWEEEKRTEILMICFDEFFQSAYTRINVEYSVRRASFAIMLLFLDLYQALLDVEQVQVALTELFHRRIFTADGGRGTLGAADWLAMDFCAAGTLLIPTRPSWLLGEIFQRANHLATEQVPPPLERATFLFSLLKQLFAKLEQSRKFVRSNGELLLLTKSIHTSLVGQKTRANLAALFRQCRARLPATEEYEVSGQRGAGQHCLSHPPLRPCSLPLRSTTVRHKRRTWTGERRRMHIFQRGSSSSVRRIRLQSTRSSRSLPAIRCPSRRHQGP